MVNCTAAADVLCLGQRSFSKKVRCNWTSGYRWSTTLALSVTLGGFGADRFYLGHWQVPLGVIGFILVSLHVAKVTFFF